MAALTLLRCTVLFLCLSFCLCQNDCSDVDCPDLDNCIEEVLDSGACCTSCLQKGCTCEGYQYYDCINAGFKNGKVPEGNSYFVDYGSTQCSCPAGGGRISCDFISCPDMPPNCIEVTEPADGCMQCERVGCVFNGQKYEAGHSFHIDSCQVCHCPNEGGELLCYPVQDCNPQKVQNPMLAAPTEEDSAVSSYPYQQGSMDHMDNQEPEDYDYSPTDLPETFHQSVILSTQSSSFSKVIPVSQGPDRTSAHPSSDRQSKLELRERYEVHDHPAGREEVTESPLRIEQATVGPHIPFLDFPTQRDFENPLHTLKSSLPNQGLGSENHREYPHRILESVVDHQTGSLATAHYQNGSESVTPRNAVSQIVSRPGKEAGDQTDQQRQSNSGKSLLYMLKSTETPTQGPVTEDHGDRVDEEEMEDKPVTLHSVLRPEGGDVAHEEILPVQESGSTAPTSSYKKTSSEPATISPGRLNYFTIPTTLFTTTTTTQPPGSFLHSEGEPSSEYQGRMKEQTESKAHPDVFISPDRGPLNPVEDPVQNCCIVGQKWATENHHCNHMPQLDPDQHSICSVAEKQCCLSAMKESLCELGMISARGGETCEVDLERRCKDDSYQVCCSCCALGLQAHSEGRGCGAHQYLSYPCGHIFLTCCEEETGPSQIPLRRKFMAIPTSLPRKVLDSKFPKEAFSISGTDDAANTVEEKEDVNECQLGLGQLCQHTCTNIWGSYHCGCHQGYILQQDGHSCAPVSPDVRENSPAVIPPQTTTTTTTTSTTSTTSSSPVHINPCAGKVFYSQCACDGTGLLCASKENGPCSQQCLVVAGKPHCSCFPGFSLMADGHSCEDINECVVQSHNCGVAFVCENTPGSFLCKTKQKCISGFTEDPHGNCIDVNECSSLSKPCNLGFNCINTVGSYSCQKVLMCSQGYHASVDGTKCVDIDECQMGAHRCIGGQICHNLPGSYHCDCQTGYQYDSLRKVCTDINECWRYPGRLCAQTCENTPGSYHCSCTAGFSLAFDGKNCEDVNECDKKPCSQECANIYGSYQCYCRHGYYLHEDGHTCKDIDECSQSMGNLCAYQCVNVAGSYHCSCPPQGYTMSANGHTCNDVDECSSGTHNCSSAHTCYNLQGGFRCLSFDCPHNYKRVSDMRCERTSCPSNSVDCQNSPVRITYYQLSFQTNIIIPAQIFRTGPSPAYPSDHIFIGIIKGNEEGYFSTRKLNSFTGAVYLQRQVREPRDFLIDVEMKLLRQGAFTSFLARIYVFITASTM